MISVNSLQTIRKTSSSPLGLIHDVVNMGKEMVRHVRSWYGVERSSSDGKWVVTCQSDDRTSPSMSLDMNGCVV